MSESSSPDRSEQSSDPVDAAMPRAATRQLAVVLAAFVLYLLAVLMFVLVSTSAQPHHRAHRHRHAVQVLFALNADSATITKRSDGYQLGVDGARDVLVFTDRPVRRAHRSTVAALVAHWHAMFGTDPPNAALSALTPDGRSVDIPVELRDPQLRNGEVTFAIQELGVQHRLPGQLSHVALFIDDATDATQLVYASTFTPFDSSF